MGTRVDLLMDHIRAITQNELANSSSDIDVDELLQYINEGQSRLQAKIIKQHPEVFETEYIITAISDQEEYYLPENAMIGGKLISVEYSQNASSNRPVFWRLKPASAKYRASHISSIPVSYWRRQKYGYPQGSFCIAPPAAGTGGIFRVVYTRKLDRLDIRRAVISAVSLDPTTGTINSLTFDPNGNPPIDFTEFAKHNYFCIVDKNGLIKMRNIPFAADGATSISSTGVVTVDSTFRYNFSNLTAGIQTTDPAGAYNIIESAAIGDFIVAGKDCSTHSMVSSEIERYLIQFAAYKVFKHDSSMDVSVQTQEIGELEREIIDSYQSIDEDGPEIIVTEEWDL